MTRSGEGWRKALGLAIIIFDIILFVALTILVYLRRNYQPLASRSPVILAISVFVATVFNLIWAPLREFIGEENYPCNLLVWFSNLQNVLLCNTSCVAAYRVYLLTLYERQKLDYTGTKPTKMVKYHNNQRLIAIMFVVTVPSLIYLAIFLKLYEHSWGNNSYYDCHYYNVDFFITWVITIVYLQMIADVVLYLMWKIEGDAWGMRRDFFLSNGSAIIFPGLFLIVNLANSNLNDYIESGYFIQMFGWVYLFINCVVPIYKTKYGTLRILHKAPQRVSSASDFVDSEFDDYDVEPPTPKLNIGFQSQRHSHGSTTEPDLKIELVTKTITISETPSNPSSPSHASKKETLNMKKKNALIALLSMEDGYSALLKHATKEFTAESVLFYRALVKYKAEPSKRNARMIYTTYLAADAPLEVNLSHSLRVQVKNDIHSIFRKKLNSPSQPQAMPENIETRSTAPLSKSLPETSHHTNLPFPLNTPTAITPPPLSPTTPVSSSQPQRVVPTAYTLFDECYNEIIKLIEDEILVRFKKSPEAVPFAKLWS